MSEKLVWVGPRESDTLYSGIEFFRSITYNGSNTDNNISFTSRVGTRIDHITQGPKWHLNKFLRQELLSLLDDPDVHFMFYNPMQSYTLAHGLPERTVCINSIELTQFFRDKANMRAFAQDCIPVVPYVHFTGRTLPELHFCVGEMDGYILQNVHSSGGFGTQQLSIEESKIYIANSPELEDYILSPYLKHAAPINVHAIIFDECSIVLPPSFQLIRRQKQYFSYLGGDFCTNLPAKYYDLILNRTLALCEKLRRFGYRGVCGLDFMLTEDELYFLEINARFQASSFLLNKLLQKEGKATLHQLNLAAFSHGKPPYDSFTQFNEPESFFTVTGDCIPNWLKKSGEKAPAVVTELVSDGFIADMKLTQRAYLCRAVTGVNLCWLDRDFHLRLAPNIQRDAKHWREKVQSKDPLTIKIGILNQGVCFTEAAAAIMMQQGMIRTGVFQSVDLTLPNGLIINAPYNTKFSELTPYYIEWSGADFILCYESNPLCNVTFDRADPYRDRIATNGTVYRNAVFWATDRLRVHHQFRCQFKMEHMGCRFCNVKLKSGSFSIDDVCEVIDFYLENTQFRHFLIGGGSGSSSNEANNILTLARHIRSRSSKPIYAMCLPPEDLSVLSEFRRAGIDEIGFNLELFDRKLAQDIMPGKGRIPLSRYEAAYRESVRLWGQKGAVRSLMVLGLEAIDSFYQGVVWLCKLGVMPIISVFRPVDNIDLQSVLPPGNEELSDIFLHIKKITSQYNLSPGPDCVACQNNTLSLPQFLLQNL